MKKRISFLLCVVLLLSLLCANVSATDKAQLNADALHYLGLFLGTGKGYELEKKLTRAQGITLAVRALGKEQQAQECTCTFADVNKNAAWAAGYVGYAFQNGMTMGTSKTEFSPSKTMTDAQFLTIVLRILGYNDTNGEDFIWNAPYRLAAELYLIESEQPDESFTRGDAVRVFWNALNTCIKDGSKSLAQRLIDEGAFSGADYEKAKKIAFNVVDLPFEIDDDPGSSSESGKTRHGTDAGTQGQSGTESGGQSTDEPTEQPLTWAQYLALSPEEKDAYKDSFDTLSDFFAWMAEAQAAEQTDGGSTTVIDSGGTIDVRN